MILLCNGFKQNVERKLCLLRWRVESLKGADTKCEHFIKIPDKKTTKSDCQGSPGETKLLKAKDSSCVLLS